MDFEIRTRYLGVNNPSVSDMNLQVYANGSGVQLGCDAHDKMAPLEVASVDWP